MADFKRRVTIIGTGNVGSATAFSLATQGLVSELVLIDCKERKAEGEAIDLEDAAARLPVQLKVWANDWKRAAESEIIIISAGPLPNPDQSRLDTLGDAQVIIDDIVPRFLAGGFQGIIINITNPCDVIAHYVWKKTGFPPERVFGTGTLLDSLRLRKILAKLFGVAPASVEGYSMGEHGDSQVVPWSHIHIGGRPILEINQGHNLDELTRQTAYAGWEVLLRKGCTTFGIATATADLVRAIFNNEQRIMPVSACLSGQYGLSGLHIGVPAVIGSGGIERIVELALRPEELAALKKSAEVIQSYIERTYA